RALAVVRPAGAVADPGGEQLRPGGQPRPAVQLPARPLGGEPAGSGVVLIAAFWLLVLLLFLGATALGRRFGLAGIISQLLLAAFILPPLLLLWVEPHWQLSASQLLAPRALELAY